MSDSPLRLGTRGSQLARWQSDWVQTRLEQLGWNVQQVILKTTGDVRVESLSQIGGQGVFTKRLQEALLEGEIDLAVHSLKDLPTTTPPELVIAAVPSREDPRDALVSNHFRDWKSLPAGAVIGTGSARRKAQLLHVRPDLAIRDIRGNLDTRLEKLDRGDFDGLVLAAAGLNRLGWSDRICHRFAPSELLPAVGQGALGIEVRHDDRRSREALAPLNDEVSLSRVTAERALLRTLEAGCLAPVGADCQREGEQLRLTAAVLSPDGQRRLAKTGHGPATHANELGEQVARMLLDEGAGDLLHPA